MEEEEKIFLTMKNCSSQAARTSAILRLPAKNGGRMMNLFRHEFCPKTATHSDISKQGHYLNASIDCKLWFVRRKMRQVCGSLVIFDMRRTNVDLWRTHSAKGTNKIAWHSKPKKLTLPVLERVRSWSGQQSWISSSCSSSSVALVAHFGNCVPL